MKTCLQCKNYTNCTKPFATSFNVEDIACFSEMYKENYLPCCIGDVIYVPWQGLTDEVKIQKDYIEQINITRYGTYYTGAYYLSHGEFRKDFFLTVEEAVKEIERRENAQRN